MKKSWAKPYILEKKMKRIILIIISLVIFCAHSKELKISSLNIRVYGQGGMYAGTLEDEFRDKWLKGFIEAKLGDSDVIIFQEIMNKESLINNIVSDMNCVSYDRSNTIDDNKENHIYVVVCFNKKYQFLKEQSEDNYAYEPMALHKYRPAVYGVLCENKKKLAHIVGLHLKALPQGHQTRVKQMEILSKRLTEINDGLPIIVGGDYNTYNTDEIEDYKMINSYLNPLNLFSANQENLITYKTPLFTGTFDHFWISQSVYSNSSFTVNGPCNATSSGPRFDDLYFYNQFVSDHCPITLSIQL